MNRRSFIEKASMGTVGAVSTFHFPSFKQGKKLNVGLIGCGWYGLVITKAALKVGGVKVIAVCDVDTKHLKSGADEIDKLQGSRPKEFKNYQDLLEINDLEAVFIGTPPHWHALQFIAACKKGLDIYCEKPLAYDVRESEAMVRAAESTGNVVQIGFQRRQSSSFQTAKELIEQGKIGKVHQIKAQIHYNPNLKDSTVQDPPPSLDWEAWCGPAPKLEYRPSIGHKAWRLEKEFGNGHLVDWGIHHIDIIRTIMGLSMPFALDSTGALVHLEGKITTPDTLNSTLYYDQCPVMWEHRLWGTGDLNTQFNNGIFFYGDKASLFVSDNKLILTPVGKNQQQEERIIESSQEQENHMSNFLNAVKSRNRSLLSCPIEDAFQSTLSVQLAMISYYTRSKVNWDAGSLSILNNTDAQMLLERPYRGSYKRPVF